MLKRSCFKKTDFRECTDVLCNPQRGFYQIFGAVLGEEPDYAQFESCLVGKESLVLILLDIGGYRARRIDGEALDSLRTLLEFFIRHDKDIIFRAVYDRKGFAMESEPDDFERITEHLTQLLSVLRDYAPRLFVFQGMLIGNWGEMHGSKYMAKQYLLELSEVMCKHLPRESFCAVRKPMQYRMLRTDYSERERQDLCRVSLFNDAILASESDMGTYGESSEVMWEHAWTRAQEMEFMSRLCERVPNGGETVYGEGYAAKLQPQEITDCLRRMHITYLNRLYDCKMLDYFKSLSCKKGAWRGKSLYEYIEAHMGYRFLVKDACVQTEKNTRENRLLLTVDIENCGFAGIYGESRLTLAAAQNGRVQKRVSLGNLQDIKSGEKKSYALSFAAHTADCETELYLQANMSDGRMIHFANKEESCGVFLGMLLNYEIDEVVS